MGRRRQPDNEKRCLRITKVWHRPTPILPFAKRPTLFSRNLLTMFAQTWAAIALAYHFVEGRPIRHRVTPWSATMHRRFLYLHSFSSYGPIVERMTRHPRR